MEARNKKIEDISSDFNIPTLSKYYKHSLKPQQNPHLQALTDYFMYSDREISYDVFKQEAYYLKMIFPNINVNKIQNLLMKIGNEENRLRIAARFLCFSKYFTKPNTKIVNSSHSSNTHLIKNETSDNLSFENSDDNVEIINDETSNTEIVKSLNENVTNNKTENLKLESIYSKIGVTSTVTSSNATITQSNNCGINSTVTHSLNSSKNTTIFHNSDNETTKTEVENNDKSFINYLFKTLIHLPNNDDVTEPNNINSTWNNDDGLDSTITRSNLGEKCKFKEEIQYEELDYLDSKFYEELNKLHYEHEAAKGNVLPVYLDNNETDCKEITVNPYISEMSHNESHDEIRTLPNEEAIKTEPKECSKDVIKLESDENNGNAREDNLWNHTVTRIDNIDNSVVPIVPLESRIKRKRKISHLYDLPVLDLENLSKDSPIFSNTTTNDRLPMYNIDLTTDLDNTKNQTLPEEEEKDNKVSPLVSRLMEIFPDASPKYLKKLSKNKQESDIDLLINDILSFDYPKRTLAKDEPEEMDNTKLKEYLREILPDADPTFLDEKVETLANKPEEFQLFVSESIEKRNYPTMKEYLRKVQLSSQQKQYTTDFTVEKFLQVHPDPFAYFENPKRKSNLTERNGDSYYVLQFLKNKFPHLSVKTIASHRFNIKNLIEICKELEKAPSMKSKRKTTSLPMLLDNIPLLQEIAFIQHREEIRAYVDQQKQLQEQERLYAKECNLMKTCNCCYDDEVMPKDIGKCNKNCEFCTNCIKTSVEIQFGDGKLTFKCLSDCDSEFSLQTLQQVLNPKLFSKIALKKQVEEVKAAGLDDLESCPFCDFVTIPPREDKLFRCLNPDCMKESCRQCKEPSHVPLRCDEVEKDEDVKARVYIENKMSEALMRKCYKCGAKFVKIDGCNKMTCSCGAKMCYVCNKPVTDYRHFNGQGGDRHDLCPLFSDLNSLHHENVLRGAQEAKAELGNKKLKYDPTADLNKVQNNNNNKKNVPLRRNMIGVVLNGHQVYLQRYHRRRRR